MLRIIQFALALFPASALACATTPAPPSAPATGLDVAASSPPQQNLRYGPSEGESQISIGASLSGTQLEDDAGAELSLTDLNLQFGYGYLLSDSLELGGQVVFSSSDTDAPGSAPTVNLGLLPYLRWNFRAGDTSWLYVGAHAGVTTFEQGGADAESSLALGAHGGWKLWISPGTAFFVEPRITRSTLDDPTGGENDSDIVEILTILGFTISI